MQKLLETIERLAKTKVIIILCILAVLGFFVYKNFDFISEITFKVERPIEDKRKNALGQNSNDLQIRKEKVEETAETPSPAFKLNNIAIAPVDFELPVYFFVEVVNNGFGKANEYEIYIDFGKSNIETLEIKPSQSCSQKIEDSTIVKLKCSDLNVNESLYVYAMLSSPYFKKVLVSSAETSSKIQYSYEDYYEVPWFRKALTV